MDFILAPLKSVFFTIDIQNFLILKKFVRIFGCRVLKVINILDFYGICGFFEFLRIFMNT